MQGDLVVRAQGGDVDAFSALTVDRTNRLFATAKLILRDEERAADAVQEALLQAWLDIRALRDPDRFDAWLRRVLVRACYRAARGDRSRIVTELKFGSLAMGDTPDTQQRLAIRDQLERGFNRLSPEQRAVIVVRHYLGLSLAESAEALGIPLGTMRSRLSRATQAMRAALEADDRPVSMAGEVAR